MKPFRDKVKKYVKTNCDWINDRSIANGPYLRVSVELKSPVSNLVYHQVNLITWNKLYLK